MTIQVRFTHKPPRVSATARAHLETDAHHTYDEIVDAGLAALREDRSSLWGFGIDDVRDRSALLLPGSYIVYAYRD